MNVTIKTPYAEVSADMSALQARNLIMQAFEYANKDDNELKDTHPQERGSEENRNSGEEPATHISEMELLPEPLPEISNGLSREGYKGFLLIKCDCCGKVKGFNTKEPLSHYQCNSCESFTELSNLKMAYLDCKCGAHWKYKTNITDEQFNYGCLNCNNPISARLNNRRNTYVTIM